MSLYPKFVFKLQKLQSKNVVLMIQARVNSKRFPKKVLAKIESKPMIWHVINRIKKARGVKEVVLCKCLRHECGTLVELCDDYVFLAKQVVRVRDNDTASYLVYTLRSEIESNGGKAA